MVEEVVELDVGLDDLLHRALAVLALFELLDVAADDDEQALQMLELVLRDVLRRKAVRKRLKRRADLEDLVDVADRHVGHIGAAARHHDDVALELELADGLAHRRAAHAELLSELDLHDALARLQDALADRFPQRLADDLAQWLVAV